MRSALAPLVAMIASASLAALDGAPQPVAPPRAGPLSPEEQVATFSVPPGFEVELVAAEEPGMGKFVALTFDHAGRLWTTTALEYPIDANESPAEAKALFASGGKDRVVVIDQPGAPGRQKFRTFADGLAICLGVLPYKDGAFVQYGSEVRFYRDKDGDGKADGFETTLSGFGVEDSHLFPHQFTRVPGGVLLAQGAFNNSQVKTRNGKVTTFNKTKLARFTPDGNDFKIIGWGPCNIWGLVHDRLGQTWIQEANDTGWPMMPFLEGASYPLCGDDVPKPYAPPFPKTGKQPVGGTGLSGLALSEGDDSFPGDWRNVFFLANPITRKIQAMRVNGSNGAWDFEHLPDFVLSSDPMFRPVAMTLGPDGCLYIIDWYNIVISHNEVPRSHPDRDKARGRIWRVRHESQPHRTNFPNLYRAQEKQLLASLRAVNSVEGEAAWQEIADRANPASVEALNKIAGDKADPAWVRLRALWALGELGGASPKVVQELLSDPVAELRFEGLRQLRIRHLGTEQDGIASKLLGDPDLRNREEALRLWGERLDAAAMTSSQQVRNWVTDLLTTVSAGLGRTDVPAPWTAYHERFSYYIGRSQLEKHTGLLKSYAEAESNPGGRRLFPQNDPAYGASKRLLYTIAGAPEGSRHLAAELKADPKMIPELKSEEVLLLVAAANEVSVAGILAEVLKSPKHLSAVYAGRGQIKDASGLPALLAAAARQLVGENPSAENRDLLVKLATGFKLSGLSAELAAAAEAPGATVDAQLAAARALRESGVSRIDLFTKFAKSGDDRLRREAVTALAALKSDEATGALVELWPSLTPLLRKPALERLSGNAAGARALMAAISSGAIGRDELDGATLDRLGSVLPGDAAVKALQEQLGSNLRPVLRLDGNEADFVNQELALDGPFTVEAWVRLDPGIDNRDSILAGNGFDLNFYDSKFRAYIGSPKGDIVTAKKSIVPEAWMHVAVTRDLSGIFRLYINGELDATSSDSEKRAFTGLKPGYSGTPGGTGGDIAELRVWTINRSASEIRSGANLSFAKGPASLIFNGTGTNWGLLSGNARIERTADGPPVISETEAAALESKFTKYRTLAATGGDVAKGKTVFNLTCAPCHTVHGEGGKIGPVLDGAGASGVEPLLRNVLTPDAAMEAGYRRYRIETGGGDTLEGLLAHQDADHVTLRQPNSEDQKFRRTDLKRAGFVRGSVMPSGLLEALPENQAADLLSYLNTLK